MKAILSIVLLFAAPILGLSPRQIMVPWTDTPCDWGSLKDAESDPWYQWYDAKATQAFQACYGEWYYSDRKIGFSNFAANYFHTRPGINCGQLDNANCEVTVVCGQGGQENAYVANPAGYMIINSMVFLHMHFEAQYQGLLNALNFMNGEIGTFTSIFAPQLSQMKQDKIFIDVIMMVYGIVSAGAFNKWLKGLPYFNKGENRKNRLGEIKDVMNTFMTGSMNIVKDSMSAIDELKVQNNMANFLSSTVQSWVSTTNATIHHIMEEKPLELLDIIIDGKMWDIGMSKPDALDVTNDVRKTLYTYVVPYAWSLAYEEVGAFIATSEGLEGTEGDCDSWDPAKKYKRDYQGIDTKLFSSNRFCGNNTESVWLMNIKRSPKRRDDCSSAGAPGVLNCANPTFEQLPGWDDLDGTHWGGLHRDHLVTSAVRAWKLNGRKNGWSSADVNTPEGQDEIINKGITSVGMANIPVCSFDEAWGNAWPDTMTDNWPCN